MFFRPKSGDLHKKENVFNNFGWAPGPKNSTILVQITASPSQLLLPNPDGGLFSVLEQKSDTKAQKNKSSKRRAILHTLQANGGTRAPPLATLLQVTLSSDLKRYFMVQVGTHI